MQQGSQQSSKGCPFLVRIYYSINTEEPVEAYKNPIKLNCLEMHLWFSSTLKEVAELIKALVPATRSKQKFKFSRVVNHNNEISKKEMGVIHTHNRVEKDEKTLDSCGFRIGDSLDVAAYFK